LISRKAKRDFWREKNYFAKKVIRFKNSVYLEQNPAASESFYFELLEDKFKMLLKISFIYFQRPSEST
jgi:hypothetical protein